jgi:hypothetical protein
MYPSIYYSEPGGKGIIAAAGTGFFVVSILFIIFSLANYNTGTDVNKQKNFYYYLLFTFLSIILIMYCNIVIFAY